VVQGFDQEGFVPPMDIDAASVLTGGEHILKACASKHNPTAADINDLIKDVLKNPNFNLDEVDTGMLKRLSEAIDSGDIKIISMKAEGDNEQNPDLFVRPAEKVLCELIDEVLLSSCQHFSFNEYKNPHGNRLLLDTPTDQSVSFQLA
jgi:hypothetical protein